MEIENLDKIPQDSQEIIVKELELRKSNLYEEIEAMIENKENILADLRSIEEKSNFHRSICEEVSRLEVHRENLMEDCGRLTDKIEELRSNFDSLEKNYEEIATKSKMHQREYMTIQDALEDLETTYKTRRAQYEEDLTKKQEEVTKRAGELKQLYSLILKAKDRLKPSKK